MSGSSMAAPDVTGLATLIWSIRPEFKVADVRTLIENTETDLGTLGPDWYFGHGRIDAGAALRACDTRIKHWFPLIVGE